MPSRRRVEKRGSFGGELDELIKVFPEKPPKDESDKSGKRRTAEEQRHVNERLFERVWRKARDKS